MAFGRVPIGEVEAHCVFLVCWGGKKPLAKCGSQIEWGAKSKKKGFQWKHMFFSLHNFLVVDALTNVL